MSKKNATKLAVPLRMTDDDALLPPYDVDYSRASPNRVAGKKQIVVGPVPADYEITQQKRASRKSRNGSRSPRTVIAKRVYLYPRHIKLLARLDKNFSAAIRKV